jgi:hypothetical protein
MSSLLAKHKGAFGELRACAWLLEQGYEVYRNVSPFGCVDIVGLKDGCVEYFDAKTQHPSMVKPRHVTPDSMAARLGVKHILIHHDGRCEIQSPIISAPSRGGGPDPTAARRALKALRRKSTIGELLEKHQNVLTSKAQCCGGDLSWGARHNLYLCKLAFASACRRWCRGAKDARQAVGLLS